MRLQGPVVLAMVVVLVLAGAMRPGLAAQTLPQITQFVLRGGSNSILGAYYQGGLGFRFAGGTLLLGAVYTDVLALEPYIAFTRPWSLHSGWTLTFLASYGDLGGDYRVDRLPEIALSRGASIPGTPLAYSLDLGLGYYSVRPGPLTAARASAVPQLTATFPLGTTTTLKGTLGYRYYVYTDAMPTGQWWGSAVLTLNPSNTLSMTFTYLFQDAWGSSPLVFDALSDDHTLAGAVNLRVSPALTLQHSQTYSFISQTISARVYGMTVTLPQGFSLSVSFDDVPQKLTVSLSFSR